MARVKVTTTTHMQNRALCTQVTEAMYYNKQTIILNSKIPQNQTPSQAWDTIVRMSNQKE